MDMLRRSAIFLIIPETLRNLSASFVYSIFVLSTATTAGILQNVLFHSFFKSNLFSYINYIHYSSIISINPHLPHATISRSCSNRIPNWTVWLWLKRGTATTAKRLCRSSLTIWFTYRSNAPRAPNIVLFSPSVISVTPISDWSSVPQTFCKKVRS